MKLASKLFLLVFILMLGVGWTTAWSAPLPKVEICHIPPGNPDNAHTIVVSENALAAHEAHGDLIDGGCVPDDPECAAAACGTFIPCNEGGDCSSPVCVAKAEGGGLCVEGSTSCGGLADCATAADCGDGEICAVDTCCGRPVCIPVAAYCSDAPLNEADWNSSVPNDTGGTVGRE